MRMRKKPNLDRRMERCADYLIQTPQDWKGHWRDKFPQATALYLELGCGKGRFTCETAASMPDVLYVAVERVPDAMVIAMERAREMGLTNVFFIDGDVADLPLFFAPDEVDRIYVNFCDPWPTTRHAKRRLTHEDFLRLYRTVLADGGQVHFKTDNRPLFDWSVFQFPRGGYALSEVTRNLHEQGIQGIMTDYEEKFHNLGTPINRCVGTKVDLPIPPSKHSDTRFEGLPFTPGDILVPQDCDLTNWAVVACDQYTSQPEYWERVAERVGQDPSSLHMILPESRLHGNQVEQDISEINLNMAHALKENRFRSLDNALIYIERTVSNGHIRRGLLGVIDLEHYDYEPGSSALIRATEGTVMERIPPRVAVRKQAPIELPHVMLLLDDPTDTVIQPLSQHIQDMEPLYDFDLMEDSGNIKGWLVNHAQTTHVASHLHQLANPTYFGQRYQLSTPKPTLLFAAGDGNHSLATAKECYQRQKKLVPQDRWADLPARYALVELVNLYDPSLEFEPIHRVLFGVDVPTLLADLKAAYPSSYEGVGTGEGHILPYHWAEGSGTITVAKPEQQLPVGTLQSFLDQWLTTHPGTIDYVHGADVAEELSKQEGNIAFLLSAMAKEQLFPTVIHDGVLPRKTFSMGEAQDKRFYLEARKIRV